MFTLNMNIVASFNTKFFSLFKMFNSTNKRGGKYFLTAYDN